MYTKNRIKNVATYDNNINNNNTNDNNKNSVVEWPKIIEAININEYKSIPIIKLKILENNSMSSNYNIITEIFSSNNKILLLRYCLEHHEIDQLLLNWFNRLDKEAMILKITKVIIESNNELLKYININKLKQYGKVLKNLTIIIRKTPINIKNETEKLKIIKRYHDDPLSGGHIGINRLHYKIKANYRWKNMSKDIYKFVKNCHECQVNKAKCRNIEPLTITDTPQQSLEKIVIDTIGPLTKSFNGNQYALTIVDDLTKYLVMVPIPNKEAMTIARALVDHFILIYGPMKVVVTDCGTEYINNVFKEVCKLLKTNHKTSVPYRHQTLGSIERTHRCFNEYLRSYLNQHEIF